MVNALISRQALFTCLSSLVTLKIPFTIHYSLFTIHYSLFTPEYAFPLPEESHKYQHYRRMQ